MKSKEILCVQSEQVRTASAVAYKPKSKAMRSVWMLLLAAFFILPASLLTSCSESDDDAEAEEYPNWQARNDAFFATLEDSLNRGGGQWKKFKCFTKDEKTVGANTEYVYAKVLENGDGGDSPIYTDTVRVAYRGRLLPSTTYAEGYVFDQTYVGNYNFNTTSVLDGAVGGFMNGFATALLHMNRNDRWRVYIPYQLGYGVSGTTGIPGCSVLIFDLVLIDFAEETGKLYPWTSREI